MAILNDIQEAHRKEATTADEDSPAAETGRRLHEAMSYEGSPQEKQARVYLASLRIDYDLLSEEESVALIGILKKPRKLQIRQGSQRGEKISHRR